MFPFVIAACVPQPGAPDDPVTDDGIDTDPTAARCPSPTWSAPHTASDAEALVLFPQLLARSEGPAGRFELRPVELKVTGEGSVTVTLDAPFKLYDAAGMALTLPLTVEASEDARTFLVGTRKAGTGGITATPEGNDPSCPAAALALTTTSLRPFVGRNVPDAATPWATRILRTDEAVFLSIDPSAAADRMGATASVYIVAHRSLEAWSEQTALTDMGDGAEAITFDDPAELARVRIAKDDLVPAEPALPRAFDVVVDFGNDGDLSPGDWVLGLGDDAAFWVMGDLSGPGPYTTAVGRARGGGAFLDEQIFWPTNLPPALQPAPVLVVSHGNGHDLTWYDHLGQHLASWGIVVMSHKNNTEPGIEAASLTTITNTDWFLQNRDAVLDGALAGLVDPSRIAWLGHSRGGEGVVRAWRRISTGNQVPTAFTLEDLRAIGSIAPTVFQGVGASTAADTPYFLIVGGADGDVTGGADCPLCQSMRIAGAATGEVTLVNVHGASHNVFHNGGGFDDGVGPARLTRNKVHPLLKAQVLAWAGTYLFDHAGLREVFKRMPEDVRLPGVDDSVTYTVSYREPPDELTLMLDDFQDAGDDPTGSSSGLDVVIEGLDVVEGKLDDRDARFAASAGDAFNGMTMVSGDGFARGAVVGWTEPGTLTWSADGPLDASGLRSVAFELARVTRDPETAAVPGGLTLSVELEDAAGHVVRMPTAWSGSLPAPYPRSGLGAGEGWGNEWAHVEVPLSMFAALGVQLDAVKHVRLLFGHGGDTPRGRVGLDHLRLAR